MPEVKRYGPSRTWWAMLAFAAAYLLLYVWALLRGELFGEPVDAEAYFFGTFFVLLAVAFLLAGWRTYVVGPEGLGVRAILGNRSFAPWAALGHVGTRRIVHRDLLTGWESPEPVTDPQAFTLRVWTRNGRLFSRIGPWIARRRDLAREIRRRMRAARGAEGSR